MSYLRIASITVGILLVSLLLHLILYGTMFQLESMSNALFVVSMITFLMALIMETGAHQVFLGFRYSFRVLVSRDFSKEYPNYRDYREEKAVDVKTPRFRETLIAATVLLVVAFLLGYLT